MGHNKGIYFFVQNVLLLIYEVNNMKVRDKFVAVELNDDDTCKRVLLCKNLTDSEYKKLVNEEHRSKSLESDKEVEIKNNIKELYAKASTHDFFLAKVIYDNYVDRGYFESNSDFDKNFYDFFFNNKDINCSFPSEFEKILKKVRGK